jgi:hypothetical protein
MAIMVLRTCQQVEGGLPGGVTAKMYFNIILDFGIGLCPIIGDLGDALFRANTRNAVVLEKYLRQKGAAAIEAQGRSVPAVDPSDPDEYDRHMREYGYEPAPQLNNPSLTGHGTTQQSRFVEPKYPEPARAPKKYGGKWFGFGGRTKQPDVESGLKLEDRALPPLPQGHARPTFQK